MKSFNLLTPTNGADDWNFKENEVGFLFKRCQLQHEALGTNITWIL